MPWLTEQIPELSGPVRYAVHLPPQRPACQRGDPAWKSRGKEQEVRGVKGIQGMSVELDSHLRDVTTFSAHVLLGAGEA